MIIHVDMDAFFAAVEVRDRPELAGSPVVVGGTGRRGVVSSASYEARAYGVGSAMPMSEARRRCPSAVCVPPRFDAYREASESVMSILNGFSPLVEPLSLDEAFLDMSGASRTWQTAAEAGAAIRRRILDATRLVASVGAGPNKLTAKIASDKAKPDGMLIVEGDDMLGFLHALAVEDLWGVGRATLAELRLCGIGSIGDLASTPREALIARLGNSQGSQLSDLAQGIDDRPVEPVRAVKSVSHERTYEHDVVDDGVVQVELLRLSDLVARRLRRSRLRAGAVSIKVRLASMKTLTRSRTLEGHTDVASEIAPVARELFEQVGLSNPRIRLLGVAAGKLAPADEAQSQLRLGNGDGPNWHAVETVTDRIRERFGDDMIGLMSIGEARRDS